MTGGRGRHMVAVGSLVLALAAGYGHLAGVSEAMESELPCAGPPPAAAGAASDRSAPVGWARRWVSAPDPVTDARGNLWESDVAIVHGGTPVTHESSPARLDPRCYLFPVPTIGTWLITFGVPAATDRPAVTFEVSADAVDGPVTRRVRADPGLTRVSVLVPARAGSLRVAIGQRDRPTVITSAVLTLARHDVTPLDRVFADEFDSDGPAPADKRWRLETGSGTWGNNELQTYTADAANVRVGGGHLAVTAQREHAAGGSHYTSARLNSTFAGTYGRIEARIRTPGGAGLLPAFWMLGADAPDVGWPACGEIDIMEHLGSREPTTVHASLHGPDPGRTPWTLSRSTSAATPLAGSFHTYAVDWWPGLIQMSVDGTVFAAYTPEDVPADRPWVFDKPFYLLLNVAVGGDWPGTPAADLPPHTMLVDHVRWRR